MQAEMFPGCSSEDLAVVDTNILLAATDEGHDGHADALAALSEWAAVLVTIYTTGQIPREYLVVATRPPSVNGLGLARDAAIDNLAVLRTRLTILPEDVRVANRLIDLLREIDCSGKQVHDANIVTTMLVHGVETIATANASDFDRFAGHVRVVAPHR